MTLDRAKTREQDSASLLPEKQAEIFVSIDGHTSG